MNSYKYFQTTDDYDQWFSKNYKQLIIIDLVRLEQGIFIDYILGKKEKVNRRTRSW